MHSLSLARTPSPSSSSSCSSYFSPTSSVSSHATPSTAIWALVSSSALSNTQFIAQLCAKGLVGVFVQRTPTLSTENVSATLSKAIETFGSSITSWIETSLSVNGEDHIYYVPGEKSGGDVCTQLVQAPILTHAQVLLALSHAGLRQIVSLPYTGGALYIIESPTFVFKPSEKLNPYGVPLPADWDQLWAAWDTVTLKMIPEHMLLQKPIDLRHLCLFYIGHIPTFLDMLLNKAVGGGASEPAHFWDIFERGIDPHVDDPDHCHSHSAVPEKDEDWPPLTSILAFRTRVRARLMKLYAELENGERKITRNIARTIAYCLEHEGFHVETLLYMLIQRAGTGTRPPPGFTTPPWELLTAQWDSSPLPPSSTVLLEAQTVVLGHADSEGDDLSVDYSPDYAIGWDNESPARAVKINSVEVSWRPITNGEFLVFIQGEGKGAVSAPKSWVSEDGQFMVQTMHGPVPMAVAHLWPVLADYNDLKAYARSKGGRLPTEPELRAFFDKYEVGHEGGSNVGFRNWHPVPATTGTFGDEGRGGNGGVWEWTESQFEEHDGLVPTNLFTGYSTDFFDTKHQVVLGASYATIPRLSRRSVRNFYQRMYPYAWCGARVVYDQVR